MKAGFSPKLALLGIKKNARLYIPYLLSCAFMAAMLYVIAYLAVTPALYTVNGKVNGSGTSAVAMTMSLGSFVVSVFIALFLFYTNSFLLRRRKKEFGLYSVLGMDRGALGTILFWETLMAAAGLYMLRVRGQVYGAQWYGKVCTALIYAVMIALLLFPDMPEPLAAGGVFTCVFMVLMCLVMYLADYARVLRGEKR